MLPPVFEVMVRAFGMVIGSRVKAPHAPDYGCVVELNPSTNQMVRILQDPKGEYIAHLYGVTAHKGKLYFGSLVTDYIGVYDLN